MALIKCPECGQEVSDTAKSCPHCGYKIKSNNPILSFLNDTMNLVIAEIVSVILGVIGIFTFNKGKSEMLFWVKAKSQLGVEDAMYCIRNISKYTLMKNIGLVLICLSAILCVAMIIYRVLIADKKAVEHEE